MVAVNVAWTAPLAAVAMCMLRTGETELLVIGAAITVGFSGFFASRDAAFPRLGTVLLYVLGGSAVLGFALSPSMWSLGVLFLGVPVAFQTLLRLNHAVLIEHSPHFPTASCCGSA